MQREADFELDDIGRMMALEQREKKNRREWEMLINGDGERGLTDEGSGWKEGQTDCQWGGLEFGAERRDHGMQWDKNKMDKLLDQDKKVTETRQNLEGESSILESMLWFQGTGTVFQVNSKSGKNKRNNRRKASIWK